MTIFDTMGRQPGLTLDQELYDYPSIQIRVRDNSYTSGWNLIEAIRTTLHGRGQETWNGTLYSIVYCANGPAMLDIDEQGRVRFIVNFNIQRR